MEDGNLRERLAALLVKFTGEERIAGVADDTRLYDCGLDSLTLFNFLLEVERTFGIVIPESRFVFEKLSTFGGVLNVLKECVAAGSSPARE